jgi:hypothetical protein
MPRPTGGRHLLALRVWRSKGDGGLHWDEGRQRWIATVTIGYDGRGKRITRKASGKTKTEAKDKLREIKRDYEDGMTTRATAYSVAEAVNYWLASCPA